MTNRHKTAFYTDGHFKVEYCTICSAEECDLHHPCCGEVKIKKRTKSQAEVQKEIDDQRDFNEIQITPIPIHSPSADELHSWGMIRFQNMTCEEFEKKYPKPIDTRKQKS